jgi:hypothetical protein
VLSVFSVAATTEVEEDVDGGPLGVLSVFSAMATTKVEGYVDGGPSSWRTKCRNGFMTLPPVLLQEQHTIVLLLKRVLVSWSLVMDEYGEHEDLRGLDHRSVIPHVHGRMELYCSRLALPV